MFHSRRTNNKFNKLLEKVLRIVYDDNVSTFNQLLAIDKSFCIEIYKALHDVFGTRLKELFLRRESTIKLRSKAELVIPQ